MAYQVETVKTRILANEMSMEALVLGMVNTCRLPMSHAGRLAAV